jgi:C_GCAxxG_C_C family probable redox protein
VNVASAFCGGVGRTHQDICGAFTGAVIAVGYLYGRTEQGKDLNKASSIVSEFRRQFLETFGSNNCAPYWISWENRKNSSNASS